MSQIWEIRADFPARARAVEPQAFRCRSPAHGTTQYGAGVEAASRDVRRRHRLTAWYTGDELEKVRRAAAAAGMAPAAWLAKLGTSAAESQAEGAVPSASVADAVAAISDAMALARRLGYLFNQAVAKLNATGEHSPDLEGSAAIVARAVRRMESATLRAAKALR